jgi:class 3 adenylate cyclase/tetratricopeptide (TPR) repeat protein
MPVCAQCGQDNPEVAKFCLACGSPLEAAEPSSVAEERKLITAVFCDLVGSTARSERLDVEDVKALVAPYHARVRGELERHGGTFEKFSGDAILALFGSPRAHEDDPERAVRAALAVRKSLAELNAEDDWLDLHFRIGINTGEALVMLGARPSEGEWSAAGDVMNTAARIESAAPVDGILVGEQTYRATRDLFEFREEEPVAAKGKSEPVSVWEVLGENDAATVRPPTEIPLVGRDAELEQLLEFARETLEGRRPGIATVLGSPGVGKTRLLAELVTRLDEGSAVYRGRCLPYGEGITYWPVNEILKAAAGIRHDDDAEANALKLGALLERLPTADADHLRTIAAALSNLSGVPTTPQGTYSAEELSQAELHWGLRRLFELLADDRPTVLVFEDLHWAEPTLLELLQFVGASESPAPLLVLASARPEAKETGSVVFTSDGNRRALELDALGAAESEALISELSPEELSGALRETVRRNAGGNPLFLEETVRMLSERGALAGGAPAELGVPESLQALIASRLDQLPGFEKGLAQNGAVVGAVFWPGAIVHLDGAQADVPRGLQELERRDLIRAAATSTVTGEDEFAFKHILIRDVAYGQLPKRRRSILHARVAEWVGALPGGAEELVEIVAYHLEQACLLARDLARPEEPPPVEAAISTLIRAGEKAERHEGMREAERFYARALEIADPEDAETVTDLHLRRARILIAQGDLRTANEQLTEVAEAARAIERKDLRASALLALANIDWKQGRAAESSERLVEARDLASTIGHAQLQIQAAYLAANNRGWFEGASEAAIDDFRSALELAEKIDDRALRIEGHMRLGAFLFNLGRIADAEHELSAAVRLAGEMGSHRDEARATSMLGLYRFYLGDIDEAERIAVQALEWLERTCDSYLQVQNLRDLARYALARGRPAEAEERLREALPLALEGGGWLVIETYRYLVEALVRQQRLDDARELLAFAARSVPEEDAYARAALAVAEAIVATGAGEATTAATAFSEALRLLEEQQLVIDLGETRVLLARALRSFGDAAGARTELERSRALFAGMEARTLVEEIDRELAELSERAGSAGPLERSSKAWD